MNEVIEIKTALDSYARTAESGFRQLTEQSQKTAEHVAGMEVRMDRVEQRLVRGGGYSDYFQGSGYEQKTLGSLVEDDGFADFLQRGARGHYKYTFERKTISSLTSGAGGAVVSPDHRPDIVRGAEQRLTIRDLLSVARTTSNLVQVPVEDSFTNNAATVAELATKPTSDVTFALKEALVRTLAHIIYGSRQILDDHPQLRDFLDGKLRYGLGIVEDQQLLNGAGTGTDLLGLVPQATDYDDAADVAGDNPTDTIRRAISQVELTSQLPVDAIVVNSTDWSDMLGLKSDDNSYLSGGPFGTTRPMLWGRPVVATPSMAAGSFLVGAFRQSATIYDRMSIEVLLSSEHADLFAKNMIAIRAEERLALVVTKPWALVTGSYPTA